ncbi:MULTISPECIES: hypothetical protein [unclassified Paraburkholderia]|uniref:hypothetical protein n=1 Tax=unclassified Paraburkholderia TaxID=2615204 RepID=UPI00160F6939|nr:MULTISPECIES: hypothetical protein [unclassified Paraburkholderia]MBB5406832.1 hypothetical protein [Paraburkholderia sp. HC6.4b]MBB5449099.1 hypothetical protein [Paraburkholderia sp. Kb1A]
MKTALRIFTAFVLTVPVCIALSTIDPLARWVGSESTLEMLRPLFKLVGAVGVEGEEDVVVTLLLAVSFLLCWGLSWGGSVLFVRKRCRLDVK